MEVENADEQSKSADENADANRGIFLGQDCEVVMKGNQHRKLFSPDYFGWNFYCFNSRLRQKRYDKQMAKKAARRERKKSVEEEV